MQIYLSGQKYFGTLTLRLLLDLGHKIVGVSAPRERADGAPDRLWQAAESARIPLMEAGKLNADTLPEGVDLIVCAHSHEFIGRRTRLRAKLGAIGYHPSLLPLHRGRDAIKWAIRMGERVTGGTVFWLNDVVDGGPVAVQEFVFIRPNDTAEKLWQRDLQPLGLRLFKKVLSDIASGIIVRIPQDPALATWEPSLNPPRMHRPDLLMIGDALKDYRVVVEREFEETMRLYSGDSASGC
ncbi:MAG: formyltransferase family protein [Acidobacteriota bacterium]